MVIVCSLPVVCSRAETLTMPLASMSYGHFDLGHVARRGRDVD
jgi:hypothetical protein